MSGDDLYFGYLCEYDEKLVKIFDCKRSKLMVGPNTRKEQFDLCGYYRFERGAFKRIHRTVNSYHEVEFYSKGSEVYVKTWAISPNVDVLPDETLEKYKDKVWSPSLNLMRDPLKLFSTKFKGGEKGWVTVKYAPKDDNTIFELIEAHEPNDDATLNQLPPWEHDAEGDGPVQQHPSTLVIERYKRICQGTIVQFALCAGVDKPNLPRKHNHPGTKNTCNHLLSLKCGVVRWLPEGNVGAGSFGKWYSHKMNDRRKKPAYRNAGWSIYTGCTASQIKEIPPPLPTEIVDGTIQIETSFVFDHNMIEDENNRKVGDWKQRLEGFRPHAHFWDTYLGKVDIFPMQAMEAAQVIENFEKHFEARNPKQLAEYKADDIIISVRVSPHAKYYEDAYPRCALFVVKDILKITYRRHEYVIFENWY